MLRKDINSDNNTKPRRRPSFAETSKCMDHASSETPAHTLTVPINYKRRPISQATSWPSSALNSTEMEPASMVKDANSFTASMILRVSSLILKLSLKVLDLPKLETTKSAVTHMLTAFGPILRLVMDVVHQRSQDSHASNKSTTRTHYKRTWDKSKKRKVPLEYHSNQLLQCQHQLKCQFHKWTTNNTNSQWWWNHSQTTQTWALTTIMFTNNHNYKASIATTKSHKWTSHHFQLSRKHNSLLQNNLLCLISLNHSSANLDKQYEIVTQNNL